MAVRTVATMWAAYHLLVAVEAAAQPVIAPAMVKMWRRIRKKPHTEGTKRRERVKKMQLEAAPKRM